MNWMELLNATNFDKVRVTILSPVRRGESYTQGTVQGFKAGVIGGGHKFMKKDGEFESHSFDSSNLKWLKKPRVFVVYDVFTFGGKQHCDWIEVDNCEFEIIKEN